MPYIHISQARLSSFLIGRLYLPIRGRGFEPITILLGWTILDPIFAQDLTLRFFDPFFAQVSTYGLMRGRLPHSEPNVSIRFLYKNWYSAFLILFLHKNRCSDLVHVWSILWLVSLLVWNISIYIFKLEWSLETHLCRYHFGTAFIKTSILWTLCVKIDLFCRWIRYFFKLAQK